MAIVLFVVVSEAVFVPHQRPTISKAQLSRRKTGDAIWIALGKKVYDITKFLERHPGGREVLLEHAGTEADEAFSDVGHPSYALSLIEGSYLGDLKDE